MTTKIFNAETQRRRENKPLKLCVSASLRLILMLIVCVEIARAQTISGTVTDERNAPIENAKVALSASQNIISQTVTNAEGRFSLDTNGSRNMTLRVTATGFAFFEKQLKNQTALEIVLSAENVRESVTVSITRTETRLTETPASVVVLDRQTLEQTAAQTVDDALRQVPGFTLFRRSSSKTSNPTTQGANLRGLSGSGASRTAVLLDGVSLNDAFGGWTYWTRVPRAAVEQVEVLRGSASSIYGSGALSGAINVLSAQPNEDKPVLRLETSAGTQETFDGSLFAATGKSGWFGSIAAESFQTAGYVPIAEDESGTADARANSRHNSLLLNVARNFSETASIFGRGNLFTERRDNGTQLQNNRTYFRQVIFGGDFANKTFGTFALRSFVEAQVYDQIFSAVSADRNSENLTRVQRVPSQAVGANLFWSRPFNTHTISAGAEAREVRGFSDEIIFGGGRPTSLVGTGGREFTFGVFVQDFWRVNDKLNFNFGGRFDRWTNADALSTTSNLTGNRQTTVITYPERRESAFSPRLAAIYQVNDKFSVTASFGQSFRAPTLNELYRAFRVGNVLTLANENLRAERAANGEIGFRSSLFQNKLNVRGTAFLAEVSRPIVNATLSVSPNLITRQRENLGRTRSRGVEFDAEFSPASDWQLSAGYLFVDARVVEFPANTNLVGKFLPQVAKHQFTFQTFYRPQLPFSIGLQGRISGAQFEDDQNDLRLRPFFTLDAFASYRPRKNLEFFLAAENIFNNRYDVGLTPVRTVAAPGFLRGGFRFNY